MTPLLRYITLLLTLTSLSACAEEPAVPKQWKSECIGRFQLSLPTNLETALSFELKKSESSLDSNLKGDFFKNGDVSERNVFSVDSTAISVSHSGLESDFEAFKKNYFNQRKSEAFKKPGLYAPAPVIGNEEKINADKAFGWSSPNNLSAFLFRQDRGFAFHTSKYKNEANLADSRMRYFLANFVARSQFSLPKGQGICIPYGFIKDDGGKYRNIGVSMRLIDQPDVEIFFKDTNASGESEKTASEYKGSRGEVEFFWSYYGPTMGNQLHGTLNKYHKIKLADYSGEYAFATIARPISLNEPREKDGETNAEFKERIKNEISEGTRPLDYGFMASFKGDPSKVSEPDLTLYVIRTASRAVAAGKQPVSEKDLKIMALQIAASIQRRKVD